MRAPLLVVAGVLTLLGCSEDDGGSRASSGGSAGTSASGGAGAGGAGGTSATGGTTPSGGSGPTDASTGGASGGTAGAGGTSGAAGTAGSAGAGGSGAGGTSASGGGTGGTAATGCGKSGAFVGLNEAGSIQVGAAQRSYVLSVPADYVSSKAWPLIFGFHGLNADGKAARSYLKLEGGGTKDAIFVYPTATNKATGWKMKAGEGDVEFFDALLASLEKSHCVDAMRVYATGFSHGAMFTNNLTCSRADKLRAVAPTGGAGPWLGSICKAVLPAMITHGKTDGVVPFSDGQKTRDYWLGQNGCGSTTKPHAADASCVQYDGCSKPVVWCAFDGGHTVPTFAGAGVKAFLLGAP